MQLPLANGVTSVLVSILAIVAAMRMGFTLIFIAANHIPASYVFVHLAFAVAKSVLILVAS